VPAGGRQDQPRHRAHRDQAAGRAGRHAAGPGRGHRGSEEGGHRGRRLMGPASRVVAAPAPAAAERRFHVWRLAPTLAALALLTLLPALSLVTTSLTPLNLTRPETAADFSRPLRNYGLLLSDTRFRGSLWVQAKLSFWTVGLQLLLGLAVALALAAR